MLENYPRPRKETQDSNQNRWVEEVRKHEGHISPSPDVIVKVPSWRMIVNEKGELNISKLIFYIEFQVEFFLFLCAVS